MCDSSSGSSARVLSEAEKAERCEQSTYGEILKSSALIGGSSVLNIAIGIVRTKVVAMLLGPAGFGLFGLYGSVANFAQSVAGMGVNSSGVRQIAEAVGSGNIDRIARTATVLRRTSVLLGLLGAVLLTAFSRQVSVVTFGTANNAAGVSLLSLAVFLTLVSWGQGALIQGMRRIADLAKMGVLGTFFGLLITVPVVFFLREKGVVPSLVGVAAMMVATSWWYSRKAGIDAVSMTASQVREEATGLLSLGFAFMASGMLMMGNAYAVRVIIRQNIGLDATGLYQSAWTLGGLYVAFILQSMGADFYPRLTAVASDNARCNRLVNEQALVSLLLAGPGVIATLTFAPLVISIFYSAKFVAAVELLRWVCLGAALQVITWPMGFIIIAKGRRSIFFWCEFAWTAVSLGLAWICVRSFGLSGAGIAFFGSYAFHLVLIYPIVHRLSGFRWSTENTRTCLMCFVLIAAVFVAFYALPRKLAVSVGITALALAGVYSTRVLLPHVRSGRFPRILQQGLAMIGSAFGFRHVRTARRKLTK